MVIDEWEVSVGASVGGSIHLRVANLDPCRCVSSPYINPHSSDVRILKQNSRLAINVWKLAPVFTPCSRLRRRADKGWGKEMRRRCGRGWKAAGRGLGR